MYLGTAVLAVFFAVVTAAPLSGKSESKLAQLARLLTELKGKDVHTRGENDVITFQYHVVQSAYSVGETQVEEMLKIHGKDLETQWNINDLKSRQGARTGVVGNSQELEKVAFNFWLEKFKMAGVLSKDMWDKATTYVASSKASKFSACLVVRYKPAKTKLAIRAI